ncbi:NlpC/P60 family protein [Streptomyces sp. 6N223]|uniref:NlpC/P60 family protein n=1 Tax=Streptomyces sp. 6N223 TaxID=3457412 RepID=UPI003FD529E7
MGKHRKPKRAATAAKRPFRSLAAATLSLAGAASAVGLGLEGSALAEPQPGLAEVRDRVDALHREAEEATERFNAATEEADAARDDLDRLRDEAARRTEELNQARDALGSHASAEYRSSGVAPSLQLALSSDPDDFLDRAALMDRSGDRQARAVAGIEDQIRRLEQLRAEAGEEADALAEAREAARDERRTVEDRLAEAEELLATLTAEERERVLLGDAAVAAGSGTGSVPGSVPGSGTGSPDTPAPNARAEAAVEFAYAQLGKAYGWGATGPHAFDCSGLTQAAWSAAGVALPRTSYGQVDAGTRVSRSELAPGDLVFYYAGISHVGIYVGDGQIVHASRPGVPIALAPVDSMPFAAATRPA